MPHKIDAIQRRLGALSVLPFSFLLLSCALVTSKYVPPVSGETAEITFHNNTRNTFQAFIFKDYRQCKDRAGTPGILPTNHFTTRIPTGETLAMMVGQGSAIEGCALIIDFQPQPSRKYNLTDVSRDPYRMCSYILTDDTDAKSVPVRVRRRVEAMALDENSSFCAPMP